MAAPACEDDEELRGMCRAYLRDRPSSQIDLVRRVVGGSPTIRSMASAFSKFLTSNKPMSKRWLVFRGKLIAVLLPEAPLPPPAAPTPPPPSVPPSVLPPLQRTPPPLSPPPLSLSPALPSIDIAMERVQALSDRVKCVYLFFDGSYLASPMTLEQFVKGIFYVGQGNTTRPRDHAREAGSAMPRSAVAQYAKDLPHISRILWMQLSEDQSFTAEFKLIRALLQNGKHMHLSNAHHHCGVTGQRRVHQGCLANRQGGSDRSSRLAQTDPLRTRSPHQLLQMAFDTFSLFL